MISVGIDPGALHGGAVAIDGDRRVVSWVAWDRVQRKKQPVLAAWMDRREVIVDEPVDALEQWWANLGVERAQVSVEGLFALGKSNTHAALVLGEAGGMAVGVMRRFAIGQVQRPMAKEWRWRILGLKHSVGEAWAEQYAVDSADNVLDWPGSFPRGEMTKKARGGLAEAGCIARDRATHDFSVDAPTTSRRSFRRRSRWA